MRNVFGGAEHFEANVAVGTTTRKAFHASLTKPLAADLLTQGELTAFGLEKDCSGWASCKEGVRGVRGILRVSMLG